MFGQGDEPSLSRGALELMDEESVAVQLMQETVDLMNV